MAGTICRSCAIIAGCKLRFLRSRIWCALAGALPASKISPLPGKSGRPFAGNTEPSKLSFIGKMTMLLEKCPAGNSHPAYEYCKCVSQRTMEDQPHHARNGSHA
ncbi:hypothetical protein ID866_8022 [Astraeus odoratus]|nr:hypothetical protein ID866_8022 [Astraeus odoratus]